MKKSYVLVSLAVVLIGLWLISASGQDKRMQEIKNLDLSVKKQDIQPVGGVKPDLNFGKFPLYFIFNKGQVNKKAKFYAKASRYTLWLTKEGLVFDSVNTPRPLRGHPSQEGNSQKYSPTHKLSNSSTHKLSNSLTHELTNSSTKYARDVSRLIFIGANTNPEIVPIEEAKLRVNYFIGNDKSKWNCDVPTSLAVLYKNLYKNIDLKVYGIEKQIEYDWIVKPGGNPKDIRFEYKNVKGTRLDEEGNLLIETKFGELIHKKPVCYQKISSAQNQGRGIFHKSLWKIRIDALRQPLSTHQTRTAKNSRNPVDAKFKKLGKNSYGFIVAEYDKNKELIIDPVVLAYSTYLGGNDEDRGCGIAVDNSGNVYVTGYTLSTDFPNLAQYQTYQGSYDAFITKIDTTRSGASSLIYSTYLGGNDADGGFGIAVNTSGNVYMTGKTQSTNFPILNQYQTDLGGLFDVFVTKIDTNQSGVSSLIYSTYLGGSGDDHGNAITVDSNGNAYVTGGTRSADFPTKNQYQKFPGDNYNTNAFVTRIDTTKSGASSLIYSTYLGGNDDEAGSGIAVDSSNNTYVTGGTYSPDFPILNQYQTDPGDDNSDSFVTKIDTTQSGSSSLIYSTYLGGGSYDVGTGIAVDNNDNVHVTGLTYSIYFPTLNQYQTCQGYYDAFVTKIDTNKTGTSGLIYSTYLGGKDLDTGAGIAVDNRGYTYVIGYTNSTNFPTLHQFQNDKKTLDAFVTKMDTTQSGAASLIYSTYLGGDSLDWGCEISVDSSGKAYLTGYTYSTNFPIRGQHQADPGDNNIDAFVTKLNPYPPGPTLSLQASRETESAWVVSRQYGKIDLAVENPGNIPVAKYVIHRKESGGDYQQLMEIAGSQLQGGAYMYYDQYLDKDKSYTYKFTAVDPNGVIIAESNERTI